MYILLSETTGALDRRATATLARLAARAAEPGHRDGTVYGTSRLGAITRPWPRAPRRRPYSCKV